jgi:hypothetical protein
MDLKDYLPFITGGAGALVVLLLWVGSFITTRSITWKVHQAAMTAKDEVIADKNKQIDLMSRALDKERDRNEVGVLAAQTSVNVLRALHQEVRDG